VDKSTDWTLPPMRTIVVPSIDAANALVIRIEDAAAIMAAFMVLLDFNFILLLLPDIEGLLVRRPVFNRTNCSNNVNPVCFSR
jgi:hypothetical protein